MSDLRKDLQGSEQFQSMPERIRHWILASPNAVNDFGTFFEKNGRFALNPASGLPNYSPSVPPTISIDRDDWYRLQKPGTEYAQFKMFGTLAHEIGHDRYNTGTVLFTGRTENEYVQYRAELEAQAIFNAFPIFKDLEQHPDFINAFPFDQIGYLQGMELGGMYKQWRKGELDDQAVIDRIAVQVPERSYTLGPLQDQNTDGKLTHRDAYLHDYETYIAPKLTPQAFDNDPSSPADPKHPDHALLEQIRAGVRKIDHEVGKHYDDMSERVSRCLLAACKDNRELYPHARDVSLAANALNRVDHVLMGTTGNFFAVEGRLGDPAPLRAVVSVETAIQTPVEQSDEKLLTANQSIAQEQALAQQHALAHGINDANQSGPRLTM